MNENKRQNILLDAMRLELQRNMKRLSIPGHPDPYFISYLVRDTEKVNIWGRYGAVSRDVKSRKRFCFADVRVGSYKYDQVTHGGLHDNDDGVDSYEYRELPCEDDEDVIRFNLWRLTDSKYREAIEAYHQRKFTEVNFLDENKGTPAFQKAKAEKSLSDFEDIKIDKKYWKDFVRKVGRSLKGHEDLKNMYLDFTATIERKTFISSEGVERSWQQAYFSVSAFLWIFSKKGDMESNLVINKLTIKELPSADEFIEMLAQKLENLRLTLGGKKMVSYAGPALLAPVPAGLLLHEVMGHRLEGSRLLSDEEGKTFVDKVGKKITNSEINVYDDPTLIEWDGQSLAGYYPYDDEGTAPSRAVLVREGILKHFLTTRSPIKKRGHKNNGHARAETFERPISRMGNLVIHAGKGKSWDELKRLLLKEVEKQGRKFGIILIEVEGGETGTEAYDFQAFMGEIKVAKRIFLDGTEEFVKGIDFVGTPLASLSNIIAVGKELEVDNSYCGAESGFIPVSTVSPAILLSNLELQAKDMSRLTPYALPLPWHDKSED